MMNIYETYPLAYNIAHRTGCVFYCDVSIAWAGATVDSAKNLLDEASAIVQKKASQVLRKLRSTNRDYFNLCPGRVEINSTDHRAVIRVTYYWRFRCVITPAEFVRFKYDLMKAMNGVDDIAPHTYRPEIR